MNCMKCTIGELVFVLSFQREVAETSMTAISNVVKSRS